MSVDAENSDTDGIDRRTFLKASGGTCLGTLSPGIVSSREGSVTGEEAAESTAPPAPEIEDLPNPKLGEQAGNFDQPGYPSRGAYRDMADQERRVRQQKGPLQLEEVNAVEYLGLGDGRPLNEALDTANLEGKLLRFPAGEFPITGEVSINADRCGIVGNGDSTVFKLAPDVRCEIQLLVERGRFEAFWWISRRSGRAPRI